MADIPRTEALDTPSQPTPHSHASSTTRSPPTKETILRMPLSPQIGHRQSFGENLRGIPSSPRSHRHPSFSQQALQDLLNDPPVKGDSDPKFQGKDWRSVQVGEITGIEDIKWVTVDASVEEATEVLISGPPNLALIRENEDSTAALGTFDYDDLNAYLLLVVGLSQPDDDHAKSFNELAQRGREGKPVPLRDVKDLGKKEPLISLPHTANLSKAMEVFGSGVHRVLVVKEHTTEIVGVLSQLRLVRFFWEHRQSFPAVEPLYSQSLKELDVASTSVFAINGDKPLTAALELMHNEGITSLPVLDNQQNVVGNISHVDVRLLTKSTSLPMLSSSCIHFISVILSSRGVNDGQDSYPVFHVNPYSTLAHTVAKLVATRSHRMWIVDSPSPASSTSGTPATTPAVVVPPAPYNPSAASISPHTSATAPPISAASLPGATLSGRLSGVVSLTDILNLFARASGLNPHDPNEMRRNRRRSSSSSVRRSVDSSRSEILSALESGSAITSGVGVGRSPSVNRRG